MTDRSARALFVASLAIGTALSVTSTAIAQPAGAGTAAIAQAAHPYVRVERTIASTGTPWELHLVETNDEIYVPIGVRKPAGSGPFPMILIGSGQGRDGFTRIEEAMAEYELGGFSLNCRKNRIENKWSKNEQR